MKRVAQAPCETAFGAGGSRQTVLRLKAGKNGWLAGMVYLKGRVDGVRRCEVAEETDERVMDEVIVENIDKMI